MRTVVGLVEAVQHEEEVLDVAVVFMGLVVLAADAVSVGIGCDGGDTTQQSVDLFVTDLLVLVDRLPDQTGILLRVQGREGGNCTAKHAHGVGIISEGVHHPEEILVDEGVLHDLGGEGGELLVGGQLSPDDQVGHLEEGAFFGEGLDGVASVFEDSLVAVDEADAGGAGDGVHVSWIVAAEDLALVGQFGEVAGLEEAVVGTQFVGLASAGVRDGDGVLARDLIGDQSQSVHLGYCYIDVILHHHLQCPTFHRPMQQTTSIDHINRPHQLDIDHRPKDIAIKHIDHRCIDPYTHRPQTHI